jgi:hypothetical protein
MMKFKNTISFVEKFYKTTKEKRQRMDFESLTKEQDFGQNKFFYYLHFKEDTE